MAKKNKDFRNNIVFKGYLKVPLDLLKNTHCFVRRDQVINYLLETHPEVMAIQKMLETNKKELSGNLSKNKGNGTI